MRQGSGGYPGPPPALLGLRLLDYRGLCTQSGPMRCHQGLTRAVARIGVSVLCGGLAIPAMAEAKVRPVPTQIVLTEGTPDSIIGTVSSQDKQCVRDRTVRLLESSTGAAFHTMTTDRGGRFSIAVSDIPQASSGFRVQAEPARAGNRDCEAASADVAADFV